MKTTKKNTNKISNKRLLMSELISFKTYRTQIKKHFNDNSLLYTSPFLSLKQTSFNLKKMLQIIFQYHLNKKKILVVGEKPLTKKQFFYIYKKTDHLFISEAAWINGLLSNDRTIKKFIKKKNPVLKLVKKPRLIVLYKYWNLIESESYNRRIINITLTNTYLEPKYCYSKSPTYVTPGNLTEIRKKKIQFFLSTLIEKIIKVPKLIRLCPRVSFFYKKKGKKQKKNYYAKKTNKSKQKNLPIL